MRKSQHCPHGWSGQPLLAGDLSVTLSATAIAPPMMSLSEDWLNGYRKHALPSPPGSGPYLH